MLMKEVAADLKAIYSANTEADAELNVELFDEKWVGLYPNFSSKSSARRGKVREEIFLTSKQGAISWPIIAIAATRGRKSLQL